MCSCRVQQNRKVERHLDGKGGTTLPGCVSGPPRDSWNDDFSTWKRHGFTNPTKINNFAPTKFSRIFWATFLKNDFSSPVSPLQLLTANKKLVVAIAQGFLHPGCWMFKNVYFHVFYFRGFITTLIPERDTKAGHGILFNETRRWLFYKWLNIPNYLPNADILEMHLPRCCGLNLK